MITINLFQYFEFVQTQLIMYAFSELIYNKQKMFQISSNYNDFITFNNEFIENFASNFYNYSQLRKKKIEVQIQVPYIYINYCDSLSLLYFQMQPSSQEFQHPNQQENIIPSKQSLKPGAFQQSKQSNEEAKVKRNLSDTQEECPVCLLTFQKNYLKPFSLCRHRFCQSCIAQHIQNSIKRFKAAKCLQQECPQILEIQSPHVTPPQRQRYYQILAFQHLSNNQPFLKLCPTERCQGFIDIATEPVSCAICRNTFCKKCLMHSHLGPCDQNGVIFLENKFLFRKCDQCKMVLQKNQGCNHMTCKCGYQFCYICGEKWESKHVCNSFPNRGVHINQNNFTDRPMALRNNNNQNNQNRDGPNQRRCVVPYCLKVIIFGIICLILVPVVHFGLLQFTLTIPYSLFALILLILTLIVSIPLGVYKMVNEYTCTEIARTNIFLFFYCAKQEIIRIFPACFWCCFHKFSREHQYSQVLFPFNYHLVAKYKQNILQ